MISGSSALMFHGIKLGEIKDLDIICTEDRVSEYNCNNCDIITVPEEIYNLLPKKQSQSTNNLEYLRVSWVLWAFQDSLA